MKTKVEFVSEVINIVSIKQTKSSKYKICAWKFLNYSHKVLKDNPNKALGTF